MKKSLRRQGACLPGELTGDESETLCPFLALFASSNHCVTMNSMDTTIRNLDEEAYRALKARAAIEGKTIGEMVNEAIWALLDRPGRTPKRNSLKDLKPEAYPDGNERLSEQIQEILYGSGT